MTITIGWWAIPTLITMGAFVYGVMPVRPGGYGADIAAAISMLAAMIITLAAWLIWALVS